VTVVPIMRTWRIGNGRLKTGVDEVRGAEAVEPIERAAGGIQGEEGLPCR